MTGSPPGAKSASVEAMAEATAGAPARLLRYATDPSTPPAAGSMASAESHLLPYDAARLHAKAIPLACEMMTVAADSTITLGVLLSRPLLERPRYSHWAVARLGLECSAIGWWLTAPCGPSVRMARVLGVLQEDVSNLRNFIRTGDPTDPYTAKAQQELVIETSEIEEWKKHVTKGASAKPTRVVTDFGASDDYMRLSAVSHGQRWATSVVRRNRLHEPQMNTSEHVYLMLSSLHRLAQCAWTISVYAGPDGRTRSMVTELESIYDQFGFRDEVKFWRGQ